MIVRPLSFFVHRALILFSCALTLPLFAAAEQSAPLYVQVQIAKLRSAPRQWASGVADIKFGDKLSVVSQEGDWFKVRIDGGAEGYLHVSAVTQKKIVLTSQQTSIADVAVDDSQVYLAGKGFNETVEQSFKSGSKSADFSAVDSAQRLRPVSDSKLAEFIHNGKLRESRP